MEAGKPFDIRPTGPVDIRRVEGGILNWGADMTLANNPFEVGLERLCNLDGDFEFKGKERCAGSATRASSASSSASRSAARRWR